ncbi:Uncharacterised protein [Staphylococcus aureus]|nr:Uncharacterised protein [Staphylococcus aureus]
MLGSSATVFSVSFLATPTVDAVATPVFSASLIFEEDFSASV